MEERGMVSVCGLDCGACYCYGELCQGCSQCEGKVFHAPEGRTCAIYACTVHEKGLHHCGECSEAPCGTWMETRDPKYTDEQFAENIKQRMQTLQKGK